MNRAKTLHICGTGSGVGKSVIVSALCRIFLQDGYRVCPFKAQNMALNSFVTDQRLEIGRAQAAQAQACRIEPSVDMNPVLIKPTSDVGAQIIVRGRPVGNMNAARYAKYKDGLLGTVRRSFRTLADEYEIVVMEGAGSPAEVNLKSHDLSNLKMASYARAPLVLVGDIDRGGVFAWIIGTLELLTRQERAMVKGIIINKFRGDKTLLKPGINFLEARVGLKVLGVIPYYKDISIPEEDAAALDNFKALRAERRHRLNIDIIRLPHISNFTDFAALEKEPDVRLRYVKRPDELNKPDVVIIPGTKNTISDLRYLKASGFAKRLLSIIDADSQAALVGICGGYQMLGRKIYDGRGIESKCGEIQGLNILPMETSLKTDKILARVKAKDLSSGLELSGYEIHHGRTRITRDCEPLFEIFERGGRRTRYVDGARTDDGRVLGTYIHGIFDQAPFRRDFLNRLRVKRGWPALGVKENFDLNREFDKLAKLVRENIDMRLLYKILNHGL